MGFTNIWDDTQPPDSQLANQLGLDLRNFRLDTQQRMAAISGLDASKPAFGADAQPANWNGILFFATDTGKIYQFNNPSWTDITSAILASRGTQKIFQTQAVTNHTGTTTLDDIYTIALPALVNGNTLRASLFVSVAAQGNLNTFFRWSDTGHADILFNDGFSNIGAFSSASLIIETNFYIGSGAETTIYQRNGTGIGSAFLAVGQLQVSGPLLSSGNLIFSIQSGHTSDQQFVGPILVELIP